MMNLLKIPKISPNQLDELVDRWASIAVIGGLLLVLVLTLFPYNFLFQEVASKISYDYLVDRTTRKSDLADFLINIFLFIPFGFGFAALIHKRRLRGVLSISAVTAASFGLSLAIEILQLFLPLRAPSPIDIFTNSLGGFLGCLCFRFWGGEILYYTTNLVEKIKVWLSPKKLAAILIGYLTLTFLVSIPLQSAANLWRLSNWNLSFPLLVGNELTGDRTWEGEISQLYIADRAISDKEAGQIFTASGSPPTIQDAAIAAYKFTGRGNYPDLTGNLPDLVWQGKPAIAKNNLGISLSARHWLVTKTSATSMSQKIVKNSQFTLGATVATAKTEQSGPARIISISKDPLERNLTLGQDSDDLVLRLRTLVTGNNGRKPELVVPNVFADTKPHHLIVSYGNSVLKLYIDNLQNTYSFGLTPESGLFWYFSPPFGGRVLWNNYNPFLAKFIYYASIFMPLGLILALISTALRGSFISHILWLVPGIVLPVLILEGLLASINQRNIQVNNLLICIGITLGTILLFNLLLWKEKKRTSLIE